MATERPILVGDPLGSRTTEPDRGWTCVTSLESLEVLNGN